MRLLTYTYYNQIIFQLNSVRKRAPGTIVERFEGHATHINEIFSVKYFNDVLFSVRNYDDWLHFTSTSTKVYVCGDRQRFLMLTSKLSDITADICL